jgi:hypothetical protein
MRFMMFMLPNEPGQIDPNAPQVPTAEAASEMTKYNDELVKAGVMLDGVGLHPQNEGVRVTYSGGKRTVIDGPYTEAKEAIGGYWIIQTKTKDEAIEWAKRVPQVGDTDFTIEVRQIFEMDEFPADVQAAAQSQL